MISIIESCGPCNDLMMPDKRSWFFNLKFTVHPLSPSIPPPLSTAFSSAGLENALSLRIRCGWVGTPFHWCLNVLWNNLVRSERSYYTGYPFKFSLVLPTVPTWRERASSKERESSKPCIRMPFRLHSKTVFVSFLAKHKTLFYTEFFSQHCGSGMFIPDPGSEFFPSRILTTEPKYFNPKKFF